MSQGPLATVVAPPEPVPPLRWNTIVPAVVGLALCGVHVILLPETQYEYCAPPSVVTTLPEAL